MSTYNKYLPAALDALSDAEIVGCGEVGELANREGRQARVGYLNTRAGPGLARKIDSLTWNSAPIHKRVNIHN